MTGVGAKCVILSQIEWGDVPFSFHSKVIYKVSDEKKKKKENFISEQSNQHAFYSEMP